jgi:hypothetical protein
MGQLCYKGGFSEDSEEDCSEEGRSPDPVPRELSTGFYTIVGEKVC